MSQNKVKQFMHKQWAILTETAVEITPSAVLDELACQYEVSCLPDMVFKHTHVHLSHESGCEIHIDIDGALKGCVDYHKQFPEPQIRCAAAQKWRSSRSAALAKSAEVDLGVDWTYATTYSGDIQNASSVTFIDGGSQHSAEYIDFDYLRSQAEPILFYDAALLFEDELHDCGYSRLSYKFRVMEECFLLLLRYVCCVDGVEARCRDTRIYCKFADSRVVREISNKVKPLGPRDAEQAHNSPDEMIASMVEVSSTLEVFTLAR